MRTLTVTGTGTAPLAPDSAVVRVAAVHRAPTVAEALAGASSAGAEVLSVSRSHVDMKRIASLDLTVWPAHDYEGHESGFEARHGFAITCGDVDVAGALVEELATRVGDRLQVDGVSLGITDAGVAVHFARSAAFADALARAEHLAALAGVTLGDVQSLVESVGSGGPIPRDFDALAKGEVVLQPGEGSLGQWVTVTWAIV